MYERPVVTFELGSQRLAITASEAMRITIPEVIAVYKAAIKQVATQLAAVEASGGRDMEGLARLAATNIAVVRISI